jgi:hypothetical protein
MFFEQKMGQESNFDFDEYHLDDFNSENPSMNTPGVTPPIKLARAGKIVRKSEYPSSVESNKKKRVSIETIDEQKSEASE